MAEKATYEELEQRIKDLEKKLAVQNRAHAIGVSGINIAWDSKRGTCTFENLPVAMMWVDTTLAGLMSGIQAMIGTKRFSLALQSEGRKSVEADWTVISQFPDFRDGFRAIANIAAVAGWGNWQMTSLDMGKKEAVFRVFDSWEGGYQKALGVFWGSGMLAGKMAGYCSKLFETTCWANQSSSIAKGDAYDEFVVAPSERSIEQEIENLLVSDEATRADMAVALQKLQKEMAERKQAEEALKDSKTFLHSLIRTIPDLVWFKDPKGTYLACNSRFESFFGAKEEDIVGKTDHDFVGKELADFFRHHDRIAIEKGKPYKNEETIVFADDGHSEILETIKTPMLSSDGQLAGVLGIGRDITDRKKAETEKKQLQAQLQRAEKMEAIGTLAGGVAHDLNNVLSGLVSYPDLMLTEIPKDSPLREPIMTIKDSGQKAAAIVQDLLTLARRGVAVSEVTNLNQVVNEYLQSPVCQKIRTYYPNIKLECNLEDNLLPILASPVHVSNIIMNLVSNAAEASSGVGLITISTKNRYVDKLIKGYDKVKEGDYAVLTVADNGVGISPADLEKIFEPFYTKKVMGRSGTGLGLAVVWGTVKDHKGYIDVESTEEKGTIFRLYFPVTREEAEKQNAPTSMNEYRGHGERILVIDDVEEQRRIAATLLTKLGYSVDAVSSGEEAVDYVKNSSPDLLILDMIMDPGIDGLDTYKKILEVKGSQKAVLTSGFSETDRVKEAQRLGAGQYIKKPYTLEKIGLAVKSALLR